MKTVKRPDLFSYLQLSRLGETVPRLRCFSAHLGYKQWLHKLVYSSWQLVPMWSFSADLSNQQIFTFTFTFKQGICWPTAELSLSFDWLNCQSTHRTDCTQCSQLSSVNGVGVGALWQGLKFFHLLCHYGPCIVHRGIVMLDQVSLFLSDFWQTYIWKFEALKYTYIQRIFLVDIVWQAITCIFLMFEYVQCFSSFYIEHCCKSVSGYFWCDTEKMQLVMHIHCYQIQPMLQQATATTLLLGRLKHRMFSKGHVYNINHVWLAVQQKSILYACIR